MPGALTGRPAGLRAYAAVAGASFRRHATYRAATLAGVITNSFFGVLLSSVAVALYRAKAATAGTSTAAVRIAGYSMQDIVTQIWVSQGLLMTVAVWGWVELGERIRSGDIAIDLYRPVDLHLWWLAHDNGRAAYQALIRGTAPFVLGSLVFTLRLPRQPITVVWFVVSVVLANAVCFGLRFLTNATGFWVLDVRGVTRMGMLLWSALSGATVSLALFPARAQRVVRLLPFAQIFQAPVDVWLERRQPAALARLLGLQALWALVLAWLCRLVLARARTKVVVQGG